MIGNDCIKVEILVGLRNNMIAKKDLYKFVVNFNLYFTTEICLESLIYDALYAKLNSDQTWQARLHS